MKDAVESSAAAAPPSHWRRVTLGEIYDIGSSKRVLQKQWKTSGVPFYRAREIVKLAKHGAVENELFISEEHFSEMENSHGVPQPGDLMVSAVGTLGACYAVRTGDRFYFKDASVLWFRPKAPVDPWFMQYAFLSNDLLETVRSGEGATVGTFTIGRARATEFVLPPLEEQKRIVAVLDQAFTALDRARAHAEANLADAARLFEMHLASTFDPSSAPVAERFEIAEVFDTSTGITPPKSEKTLYGRDLAFVKPPELIESVVGETQDGLSLQGRRRARLAPPGAVLVSCIGNLGKVGLLKSESAFNQQINAILPDAAKAIPDFIFFQCRSAPFKNQLQARAGGTTVSIVNKRQFNALPLWLPGKAAQQDIGDQLKAIEMQVLRLRDAYSKKLAELSELRQALLQEAFAGRLT